MLDKKWLQELKFDAVCGGRIEGLEGLGAHMVVFKLIQDDGSKYVVKVRRHTLGLHINEIPPFMSRRIEYDLDRLNNKLLRLVGDDTFDTITHFYDRLYSRILYIASVRTVPGLLLSNTAMDSIETVPFIIHTPPFARRLAEFASWPCDPNDPLSLVPKVNGPESPIQLNLVSGRVPPWITTAQKAIESLSEYNKALDAASLFRNPLVIWGAAAMEGFFTDEEIKTVVSYIHDKFGTIASKPNAETLVCQLRALGSLMSYYLMEDAAKDSDIQALRRFVRLCSYCGATFTITRSDGTVVAA
jgi:hypothetical protein